jgi:hypothetical protein
MGKNWKYDDCLGCTIAKIDQDDAVYGMNVEKKSLEISSSQWPCVHVHTIEKLERNQVYN